jgi:diadenosine tetraphosphatase ApaH/serine/threonine PP2A family protein phosphatase
MNNLIYNSKKTFSSNVITNKSQSINLKPIIVNKVDISFYNKESFSDDSSILKEKATKSLNLSNFSVKKISLQDNKFTTINDDEDFSELYENFINTLLKPHEWKTPRKGDDVTGFSKFRFRREHIIALTRACQEIIASQPIVLRISTPVKVFGDIHGQYDDLMRFFELWGEPSENAGVGDIQSIDYLFLGDYVDRGINSLETICLLMALKIKYPDRIHLLRGNHEDMLINVNFGFKEECDLRLFEDTEDEDLNVYRIINEFFDYLPLAAIIEDQILCLHGGIGGCLTSISEIQDIDRPLTVIHEATNKTEQIIMDILWSDPTDNDDELGIQSNPLRDTKAYGNIVKYGPDVVERFLKANNLSMIIRAHECVPDGFERFDGGHLITLFSATDYCRRHKNAGAMLLVKNNFEIVPHLIYPLNSMNVKWIDNEESLKKRPPTPIRRNKKREVNSNNVNEKK